MGKEEIVEFGGVEFDISGITELIKSKVDEERFKKNLKNEIDTILREIEAALTKDIHAQVNFKVTAFNRDGLNILESVILETGLKLEKRDDRCWEVFLKSS